MVKIKVEGPGALVVGKAITKALRDSGLKVNHWYDLAPKEVPNARRDATRECADVSVVTLRH